MAKKSLILIGGGGHCKACIDVIEAEGKFDIFGILDSKDKIGKQLLGYPFIGTDDNIDEYVKEGYSFLIALGQIKTVNPRKMLFEKLKSLNADLPIIISPYAVVSKHTLIGAGTIIMHSVNINAGANISNNCILNTGCNIEHDVIIGENSHVSTSVVINGNCMIGKEVFIGSGSIITNGIQIKPSVVIGAGSLIFKNIDESGTFVGNPLRKIKHA